MNFVFRGSVATLVAAGVLLAAPTLFAQTEPRQSDPVYPCPPPDSPNACPDTTKPLLGCSLAAPGQVGAGAAAALAPFVLGLVFLGRRRRALSAS